jgi:arylformamidase
MTRFVRLSYEIREGGPAWPGDPGYNWEQVISIARGDVANRGILHLSNHFGTHLDAPNHFNDEGPKIADVPLERFIYERPLLIDAPKGDRELVSRADLEAHDEAIREADLVLIRTGWGGVSPEACDYLIEQPQLKAIALDIVSLASYHRLDPEGILAHQILCGVGRKDRYVIIIEDVDLLLYPADARRVYAVPLFPKGADSSPCTVFAEVAD